MKIVKKGFEFKGHLRAKYVRIVHKLLSVVNEKSWIIKFKLWDRKVWWWPTDKACAIWIPLQHHGVRLFICITQENLLPYFPRFKAWSELDYPNLIIKWHWKNERFLIEVFKGQPADVRALKWPIIENLQDQSEMIWVRSSGHTKSLMVALSLNFWVLSRSLEHEWVWTQKLNCRTWLRFQRKLWPPLRW